MYTMNTGAINEERPAPSPAVEPEHPRMPMTPPPGRAKAGVADETPIQWTRPDIEQAILTVLGYADEYHQDGLFEELIKAQVPGPYLPIIRDLQARGLVEQRGANWALVRDAQSSPAQRSRNREQGRAILAFVAEQVDAVATAAANLNDLNADALADLDDGDKRSTENWLNTLDNALQVLDDELAYLRGCLNGED